MKSIFVTTGTGLYTIAISQRSIEDREVSTQWEAHCARRMIEKTLHSGSVRVRDTDILQNFDIHNKHSKRVGGPSILKLHNCLILYS